MEVFYSLTPYSQPKNLSGYCLGKSSHFYSKPSAAFMRNVCVVGSNIPKINITARKFGQFFPRAPVVEDVGGEYLLESNKVKTLAGVN